MAEARGDPGCTSLGFECQDADVSEYEHSRERDCNVCRGAEACGHTFSQGHGRGGPEVYTLVAFQSRASSTH